MTDVHIPDTSEYQQTVDTRKLPAVILRAHNGHRADRSFAQRWAQARRTSRVRMAYGYVVANRDAAEQGREAAQLIGKLQPGEMVWCDLEEGTGDQSARAEAWCREVDAHCGGKAGVYSGESFFGAHLAGVHRTRWVAAYRASEPRGPHLLWQNTDKDKSAGVSGPHDESVFHGSLDQLRATVDWLQGRSAPAAASKPAAKPAAPAKPASAPATPTANLKEERMLVQFKGGSAVWEVCGSKLYYVSATAWRARALRVSDVHVLGADHPLSKLPKVTT
ncbi:MAG: hypothetical protein JWP11_1335 [Frankiales bacterium]|nr:hypothetical protein [Frankiales bacterium]